MPRSLSFLFGTFIAGLLIAGPISYYEYRYTRFRNLHVVRNGVLYRSGQMSLDGLKHVIHDHEIKTVITLRDAHVQEELPPDLAEEEFCKAEDITHYRIPPRTWSMTFGSVPAEKGVRKFLQVMDDPRNYPVLIHCMAGSHRTGAYCAIYRMEYEHWSNAQALAEMKDYGYCNLDDEWDILGYLEQYRPRWQAKDAAVSSRNQ